MKRKGTRILSILTALTLLATLPLPVTGAEDDAGNDDMDYRMVKDHVPIVVSMGDSYSSGEGASSFYNGDKYAGDRVNDQDWLAHRAPTAWSGRLFFKDENGKNVHMYERRYDSESLQGTSGEDARWYFAASSGAITDDIDHMQGKAFELKVRRTPDGMTGLPRYMIEEEMDEYFAAHPGLSKADYLKKADKITLEDNAKGKDEKGKPAKEPLIDPQINIFGKITSSDPGVEYVTLTLGGNDLGFTNIVEIAVKDFGQDFCQVLTELDDKAIELLEKTDDKGIAGILKRQFESVDISRILKPKDMLRDELDTSMGLFETGKNGEQSIAEKLTHVYNEIKNKAPHAVILVAGYPKLFDGADPGLYGAVFTKNDVDAINSAQADFQIKMAAFIRNLRENDDLPIYYIPVDGAGAFQGRGAYTEKTLMNPVMFNAVEEIADIFTDGGTWNAYDQELIPTALTSSASMHPTEEGHGVYAACVQDFIDHRIPIDVTGKVCQVDEDHNLQPVPEGSRVVLTLKDGPLSPDSERLSELRTDDAAYQGALKGEYTADIKRDGTFTVRALSGEYNLKVVGKDGKVIPLYRKNRPDTENVELKHHNCKEMDIRVVAMQEISGRVFAVDEEGKGMEVESKDLTSRLVFVNPDWKNDDPENPDPGIVGTVDVGSIPKTGTEYKLRVPVGTTEITLQMMPDEEQLPLYGIEDDVIRTKVSVKQPMQQGVVLEVENVKLTGQITAVDDDGTAREYDLSDYPLEMQLVREGKKVNASVDWVSAEGTTEYCFETAPGDYVLSLTGNYGKAGYILKNGVNNALEVTLPLFRDTTQDLKIHVKDQKLSGKVYVCDKDGKKVKGDYTDGNLLQLTFVDKNGEEVGMWETAFVGTGGADYSVMLPPGKYAVKAAMKDGTAAKVIGMEDGPVTVTVPLGSPARSDIQVQTTDLGYLGIWSNEITAAGLFGISAGVRLELNIEKEKITFTVEETSDLSTLEALGLDILPEDTGHTEAYEGKWTETDDGIAMNISGYNLYFIRLNENQLYMDLDRLEQDAVDEGAGEMVLLLEALKSIAYMDVGSLFGLFGGFDMDFGFNTYDMMGIDSLDDMFVFTREK